VCFEAELWALRCILRYRHSVENWVRWKDRHWFWGFGYGGQLYGSIGLDTNMI
jgi:hypothetical protein